MRTLLLDTKTWDLCLDTAGNIAVASEPYALAQDAACAIRTFQGEVYYDVADGVPYWASILGRRPPTALVRSYLEEAARTVPGVATARCLFTGHADRRLMGQVQITATDGTISAAGF